MINICGIIENFIYLQSQTVLQKPWSGDAGVSADIMESVYSTLFLDNRKSGKFHSWSGMKQMVDAL